jgi:hypothetical protein
MSDIFSVGLAAKLVKAFESVGATPEQLNWLAEHRNKFQPLVAEAATALDSARRFKILPPLKLMSMAEVDIGRAFFEEEIAHTDKLLLVVEFSGMTQGLSEATLGGTLSAVQLMCPSNYGDIKKYLTPTTTFGHILQFVRHELELFDGKKREEHYFMLNKRVNVTPKVTNCVLAYLGFRISIDDYGIYIFATVIGDDRYFPEDSIVHSFTPT